MTKVWGSYYFYLSLFGQAVILPHPLYPPLLSDANNGSNISNLAFFLWFPCVRP